ncbi:ABC transporter substrate-binding protein [Colwelliaceae bacterium MEBiC 14330]
MKNTKTHQLVILIAFIFFSVGSVLAKPLHVTFVVPDQKGPLFWQYVSAIAESVADDIEINLELIYTHSDRFALKEAINKISNRKNKPDYLIFRPFRGNATAVFKQLEASEIPFVTLEQDFIGKEANVIGLPREKYKYWLGQVNYDNEKGGYLLLSALIKHQRKHGNSVDLFITGIGGDNGTLSNNRTKALYELGSFDEKINLNQIFSFYWNPAKVKDKFNDIYRRYPETNIFWCAGDQMALALIEKIQSSPSIQTKKISVGGFDWLPQALEKIKSGDMAASVGGHMLMAGVALLKIKDYDKGVDRFSHQQKANVLEVIDTENVQQFLPFLSKAPWPEIDFSVFLHHDKSDDSRRLFNTANIMKLQNRQQP